MERAKPLHWKNAAAQNALRRRPRAEHLSAASQIVPLAEQEQEYDVSVVSTLPPTNPPLDIGGVDEKGTWQSWAEPYHLEICCRVRESLVRLCHLKSGEDPNTPDFWNPKFDEDCTDDESEGFFEHPLLPSPIRIPNAGCGRFWIEFEYGKWLYPRPKNDGVALLAPEVTRLAAETFGTAFVEACLWG